MSTFDLTRIVDALQSTKIKSRNDALGLLEGLPASKLRLETRQFNTLATALLKLIQRERDIYAHNSTNPVVSRLSTASNFLWELVDEALKKPSGRQPRFKHLLAIVTTISSCFFTADSVILGPCATLFAKILKSSLSHQFFLTHLTEETWTKLYKFHKRALEDILDHKDDIHTLNETLLQELYQSLYLLIGGESPVVLLPLLKYDIYFPLLRILKLTLRLFKNRESMTVVVAFKIINKLLIVLSTEDYMFLHELINIALRSFNMFVSSPLESIQKQIAIFLNLETVYRYVEISSLPKLIGSDGIITSSDDEHESIPESSVQLYNIGSLIQSLMIQVQSVSVRLNPNDIGFTFASTNIEFCLHGMYLKTDRAIPWLLLRGLSKLIVKYYDMREKLSPNIPLANFHEMSMHMSVLGGSMYKRQKLQDQKTHLWTCSNASLFFNSLIASSNDPKEQICGLQLLAFHAELFHLTENALPMAKEEHESSKTLDFNESTILDINLGYGDESQETIVAITNILKVLNVKSLTFWAFLACRSILFNTEINVASCNPTLTKRLHQILKLLIPFINDVEIGTLAADIFFHIVRNQSENDVSKLLDKTIISQLENLIDLLELSGPFSLHKTALGFFWAITKVYAEAEVSRMSNFTQSLGRWFITKWNEKYVDSSSGLKRFIGGRSPSPEDVSTFLLWMSGKNVLLDLSKSTIPLNLSLQDLEILLRSANDHSELQSFIVLDESVRNNEKAFTEISFPMLTQNEFVFDTIVARILDVSELVCHSGETSDVLSSWASSILIIADILACSCLESSSLFRNSAHQLWNTLSTSIHLRHDASLALSCVLESKVTRKQLTDTFFPFNTFDSYFQRFFGRKDQPHEDNHKNDSDFDSEFSTQQKGKSRTASPTDVYDRLSYEEAISYFKFYASLKKIDDENVLRCIETIPSKERLSCLRILLQSSSQNSTNNFNANWLIRLVRALGEGPLSDQELDRCDTVIEVSCDLLMLTIPTAVANKEESLLKDCIDLLSYFILCCQKSLLVTGKLQVCVWKMIFSLLIETDFEFANRSDIQTLFLDSLERFSNAMTIEIAQSVQKFLNFLDLSEQMIFYKELFSRFKVYQESVERFATCCLFFCLISKGNFQLRISVLFNLIECTKFEFFEPYLRQSIKLISELSKKHGVKSLFRSLRFELLKCWWGHQLNILKFPHHLFGYIDTRSFLVENYKEIIAILLSIKHPKSEEEYIKIIDHLSKIRSSDRQSMLSDSLPLIVPLAYTTEGVRNNIFKIIAHLFNEAYKAYMREKLLLQILQTIKLTDTKSEQAFKTALKKQSDPLFQSEVILDTSAQAVVSTLSSVELIGALVRKYWSSEKSEFWNLKTVYFLVRHIGKDISDSVENDTLTCLRRIKYVLLMSQIKINQFELVKLLIDICCPLLITSLRDEVLPILNSIDTSFLNLASPEKSIPLLFGLLNTASLVRDGMNNVLFFTSLDEILHFQGSKLTSALPLMRAMIDLVMGSSIHLDMKSVEDFLVDPDFEGAIDKNLLTVFMLISRLYPHIASRQITTTNVRLIKIFIKMRHSESSSDELKMWMSSTLSYFYLSGYAHENLDEFILDQEYEGVNKEEFVNKYGSLDPFMKLLLSYGEKCDFINAAFIETILGALLWKYERRPVDVTKFLPFEEYYPILKEYLIPIDFHSCVLLNSEYDMQIKSEDLNDFLAKFKDILVNDSYEVWVSQFLLSLIQEIAKQTSIASLLASSVLQIPSLSVEILPSFICFYIFLTGESGAAKVYDFFQVYWSNFQRSPDDKSIDLIKNIILSIRMGLVLQVESFRNLYKKLNVDSVFKVVKEGNLAKTSLMLFEDSIDGKIENVNWSDHRDTIATIYKLLGEEDMLSGLPEDVSFDYAINLIDDLGSSSEKMRYASGLLDASIALTGNSHSRNVIRSMLDDGHLGTSSLVDRSLKDKEDSFEWAWKLNQWDVVTSNCPTNPHEAVFSYFKLIKEDVSASQRIFENLILNMMNCSTEFSEGKTNYKRKRESAHLWFETMACIHVSNRILSSPICQFSEEIESFEKLTSWFQSASINFSENILQARQLAFVIYGSHALPVREGSISSITSGTSANHDLCWQAAVGETFRRANLYQENLQLQKMVSASIFMNEFIHASDFSDDNIGTQLQRLSNFQAAHSLWTQGKTGISIAMMNDLKETGPIFTSFNRTCVDKNLMKATLVKWLAESRQELGTRLLERLVDPMREDIEMVENVSLRSLIYHSLAHFCDLQYKSHTIEDQIKEYSKRVDRKKREIDEIKTHYGQTSVSATEKKMVQKYYSRLKSQVTSDTSKLESLRETKRQFAKNAVTFFLKALLLNDDADNDDMDKFFSLFLELSNEETFQQCIKNDLRFLPSYKPLIWCTQLLSRISNEKTTFQFSVQDLILRVFQEHPFHSLYYLVSLIYHEEYSKNSNLKSMLPRIEAAKKLREKLATLDLKYTTEILLPIEQLCKECISLAELKTSKGRSLHLDKLQIGEYWLKHLPSIPPPTFSLAVSKTGYSNIPYMMNIGHTVSIATSGISLPKIATFTLSNGDQHKMLLKFGTDDLRQDATMEQVFEKVNNFLRRDKETRKRHLQVRTYKAVPLGHRAGVIQFVPNSKAFIEVIRPYHLKSDSLKGEKARQMMKDCQTELAPHRILVYNRISQRIKPVLRQYFVDHFVTPDHWFDAQQVYTRGIASSSMVGYVLGLGDRHCNNILLDQYTGEPVHIDLGVAFDQGKRLPIPETVPFRLTRDIVAGFGFTGTRGTFSESCKHTLRVLRDYKEHILAILDVLRWDPLYSWSISPIRMKKLQEEDPGVEGVNAHEDGSEASTAILTVKEKIHHEGLSTEATVRELIREATSEDNLALIYCGWCPFY